MRFIPSQHQAIFQFIRIYGCRPSEACNLKKSDTDLGTGIVTFGERKNDKDNTLEIFDEIKPYLKPGKVTHCEFVFCTPNGQKYNRRSLYRIWTVANRKANVKAVALKNGTRVSLAC